MSYKIQYQIRVHCTCETYSNSYDRILLHKIGYVHEQICFFDKDNDNNYIKLIHILYHRV